MSPNVNGIQTKEVEVNGSNSKFVGASRLNDRKE
jgi:hypothetical protein